jgi:hypothetical protein
MASTRNINTKGNYCLEQKQNSGINDWQLYTNGAGGIAYNTQLPGLGFNVAQIPRNKLSHNPEDIESFLFGINSTNLVNPTPDLTPEFKCLNTIDLFERRPVIMPVPQAISKSQRPFPAP